MRFARDIKLEYKTNKPSIQLKVVCSLMFTLTGLVIWGTHINIFK